MLSPAVNQIPPRQPEPLVEIRFGPLAVSPPFGPKLPRIEGSRNAVVAVSRFPAEGAERPPGVVIGSHQQNASSPDALKTAACFPGLFPRRESINRADGDRLCLGQPLDIFSRQFRLRPLIDFGPRRNIE